MSTIGSVIATSLLQTAQAQQTASKTRDKEKSSAQQAAQRYRDMVEFQAAAIEEANAIRELPHNESEQHGYEHNSKSGHWPALGEEQPTEETSADHAKAAHMQHESSSSTGANHDDDDNKPPSHIDLTA